MGKLQDFLKGKAIDEAATILERAGQAEFLRQAIEHDLSQTNTDKATETTAKNEALNLYNTYTKGLATTSSTNLVKAALIPRNDKKLNEADLQKRIIKFMFNPTELNMSRDLTLNFMEGARTLAGLPKISFGYVNPYNMELAGLLFDTYETGKNVITEYIQPIKDAMDFTNFDNARADFVTINKNTNKVTIDNSYIFRGTTTGVLSQAQYQYDDYADIPLTSKRPPIYYFIWGNQYYMMCFIQKINYKLTMFLSDGTPVRAIVDLSLQEVDMHRASRRHSMPQRMTAN